MSETGSYKIDEFPKNRDLVVEATSMAKYFNHIVGLMEIDVTEGLKIIEKYKKENGEQLSITAWFIKCAAQATSEFDCIRTFRHGKRKVVIFDDVDVKCIVEREIEGKSYPMHYIFRAADKKSFKELHEELRLIQDKIDEKRKSEKKIKKRQNTLMKLPKFIRMMFWHRIMTNPFQTKKNLGVIGVSALGMLGKGMNGWAIPKTMHQTQFTVGSIVKKPVYISENKFVWRDILNVVCTVNHDIVDGAPGVRFGRRVQELMEANYGIDEFGK